MAGGWQSGREDVREGFGGYPHRYLGGGAVRRRGAVSGLTRAAQAGRRRRFQDPALNDGCRKMASAVGACIALNGDLVAREVDGALIVLD